MMEDIKVIPYPMGEYLPYSYVTDSLLFLPEIPTK